MAKAGRIEVRDYTTKELYELTRAKQSASVFYSRPSSRASARIQQLDAQIERNANSKRRKQRGLLFTW
jgi:hypothetical protein